MTEHDHPDLELQDLLDNRLSPAERTRVQSHVDACLQCREDLDDLQRGRDFARRDLPRTDLPPDLLDDVVRRLDAAMPRGHRFVLGRRLFFVYGLGAAAAGLLGAVYLRGLRDLPSEAIETYQVYRAGQRSLELLTSDPSLLEQFFRTRLTIRTRVFDLGMMGYRLIGGRTDRLGGRDSALYLYAGPENRRLLCQMFRGVLSDLPQPSERRDQNGITFFIYSRGAHTAVFWPESDVLCVVVSDMPAQDTIALAFAKAMKV